MADAVAVYSAFKTFLRCAVAGFFIIHGYADGDENLECLSLSIARTNDAESRMSGDPDGLMGRTRKLRILF